MIDSRTGRRLARPTAPQSTPEELARAFAQVRSRARLAEPAVRAGAEADPAVDILELFAAHERTIRTLLPRAEASSEGDRLDVLLDVGFRYVRRRAMVDIVDRLAVTVIKLLAAVTGLATVAAGAARGLGLI